MSLYDVVHSRYGNRAVWVEMLRSRMLVHGITQISLAQRSGIHPNVVSRIVKGTTPKPELETCMLLDEACDLIVAAKRESA
jgi:transcriptional regulator with XRE-family HTH domain